MAEVTGVHAPPGPGRSATTGWKRVTLPSLCRANPAAQVLPPPMCTASTRLASLNGTASLAQVRAGPAVPSSADAGQERDRVTDRAAVATAARSSERRRLDFGTGFLPETVSPGKCLGPRGRLRPCVILPRQIFR